MMPKKNEQFRTIKKSMTLSNVDELIELSKRVVSTLLSHGFRLTKWVSKSSEILNSLPKTEILPKLVKS